MNFQSDQTLQAREFRLKYAVTKWCYWLRWIRKSIQHFFTRFSSDDIFSYFEHV